MYGIPSMPTCPKRDKQALNFELAPQSSKQWPILCRTNSNLELCLTVSDQPTKVCYVQSASEGTLS